jgi:hypothetical protein
MNPEAEELLGTLETNAPEPSLDEKLDTAQKAFARSRENQAISPEETQRQQAAEEKQKNEATTSRLETLLKNAEAQGFTVTEEGEIIPPAQPTQQWAQPADQQLYQQPVTQPAQNTALAQQVEEIAQKYGWEAQDVVRLIGGVGGAMLEPVLAPMIDSQLRQQINGLAITNPEFPIYKQTLEREVAALPFAAKLQVINTPGAFQFFANAAAAQHIEEIVKQRVQAAQGKVVGRFTHSPGRFTEGAAPGNASQESPNLEYANPALAEWARANGFGEEIIARAMTRNAERREREGRS